MADTWQQDLPKTIQRVVNGGTQTKNTTLRDYSHASKVFRDGGKYQNTPKFKYLFHVYFSINPQAFPGGIDNNYGLLVKSIKLPSFNIETATMNQYNRKRIIQTKIKYDPIDISFHDDNGTGVGTPNSGGTVRALWKAYYNYYYFDGTTPEVVFSGNRGSAGAAVLGGGGTVVTPTEARYNDKTQYKPSITGNADWGYIGETNNPDGVKIPFFNKITIFGFNQHLFSAYTLINPIITRFTHDTYDYAQGTGIMENQMSIDYETVVYNEGAIDGQDPSNIVTGFGSQTNYDRHLSPITPTGANSPVPGPQGLMPSNGGVVGSTIGAIVGGMNSGGAGGVGGGGASGGGAGGYGGGKPGENQMAQSAAYDSIKNPNALNVAASQTVAGIAAGVDQTPNRNNQFAFPGSNQIDAVLGKAGMPPLSQLKPAQIGANPAGYQVPSYAQQQYGRNRNQTID